MQGWQTEIREALTALSQVEELACDPIEVAETVCERHPAPHRAPRGLPLGTMAVYCFWHEGCWLKIGKAGPKSKARYTSQHYSPGSAMSTLLCSDPCMCNVAGFDAAGSGEWIKSRCCRVNLLLPASCDRALLSLLAGSVFALATEAAI